MYFHYFIFLAGIPTYTPGSSIWLVTPAFNPIVAKLWIEIFSLIEAFVPT
jgi:hypothetical protein